MAYPASKLKLNPDLYDIHPEEAAFFKQQTGIQDDELLKQHIIQVQAKAYETYSYRCIFGFFFARFKISTLFGYKQACSLLKERDRAILLDMGCCLGTDVRKAVLDGWPMQDIIASDIQKDFWKYGHQLFKSTPDTFPVAFISGDVFDSSFIFQRGPFLSMTDVEGTIIPPLNTLSSFDPVQGKISAIHISSFFHLFPEDRQLKLARIVSSLLSPEKGSVIFGQHVARPVKGYGDGDSTFERFCHSPESWTQMWVEDVFGGEDKDGNNRVKVDTELLRTARTSMTDHSEKVWLLSWSVTRL